MSNPIARVFNPQIVDIDYDKEHAKKVARKN